MAELAVKLGISLEAEMHLVTESGQATRLIGADTLVAEWTETKAVRTRKREA